ncbi:MAG: PD-(D/E)XK nuclease family protein, partial [Lachnospiraceae bacterium]|nr:PD-(D/E)XK nuclease family protein [Lachnospiraceae bacterium]
NVHGAFRGTAYHRVLELLDFSKDYTEEMIQGIIADDKSRGMLTAEMASCIEVKDIMNFLNTPIGKRMKKASQSNALFAEQPFVLGVPAREIYHQESEEIVLVQGIIDVYFEEDDEGLVVLDYKTDKVHNIEELELRYKAQLEYYAKALEQLTGKKVKEKLIYSFTLQELLEV